MDCSVPFTVGKTHRPLLLWPGSGGGVVLNNMLADEEGVFQKTLTQYFGEKRLNEEYGRDQRTRRQKSLEAH